ncbi:hypothetical protein [Stenotrophomonas nematodicola]|uniref:hypothetical protein n=1 Tax=Stenotrophomonas nematodicola TaxID=2656746 RepID=UPI0012912D91|nr:hypothetical protein [Stenotrophomonas nematodicola]
MRALRTQLDIFEHDPARLADANRVAAETALRDVQFSAAERQERHDYYLGEALRLEALARQCQPAPARRRRTTRQTGATPR